MSALLLTACGSSSSSSSSTKTTGPESTAPSSAASGSAAPTAAAPSATAPGGATSVPADAPKTPAPTKTAGGAAPAGAVNTVTIKGPGGGTYQLEAGACLGGKSTSGKLVLTAVGTGSTKASAIITFDGAGTMNAVMTMGEDDHAVVWAGEAPVGAAAARTLDTVTFADLPVTDMAGGAATASGYLKCESHDGLL
ncbi:hypothetical protein AB0E96_11595 [Kitasatospora sp. NPDC036755]|uniref:hypothetical protein n=1 Tax=Kitasatospora sp. NPDC036755 TaxID=3154600 RepID=UPI0033D608DD